MLWYFYLFQNFPQFVVINTAKDFGIINKAEVDVSLELSYFFDDPTDVANLIYGYSVLYGIGRARIIGLFNTVITQICY